MSAPVMLAPSSSLGIRWYAESVSRAMHELGCRVPVHERPGPQDTLLHVQLGNSTRSLLPLLWRRGPRLLVSLHDVAPRQPLLRMVLAPVQARLLSRHLVAVHSEHSRELLRNFGFRGEVEVVRYGAMERRYADCELTEVRRRLGPERRPVLLCAGVLKKEKGTGEILDAAQRFPEWTFAFVGRIGDTVTRKRLAAAPGNVVHLEAPADREFERLIAASDFLLNFRRGSVGEVSGPVVLAHSLGTPVIGYDLGFMGEYCGPQDGLCPPDLSVADALAQLRMKIHRRARIPRGGKLNRTWNSVASDYLGIYRRLGWLP